MQKSNSGNLILVSIFALIVLFLIGASLAFKFLGIIRESKFDGENRFTVFVTDASGNGAYVSVNPAEKSATKVAVKGDYHGQAPVVIDGRVVLATEIDTSKSAAALIQEMLVKKNNVRKDITGLDLLRMYLAAKAVEPLNYSEETLDLPFNEDEYTPFENLFLDSRIDSENKTIAIENATGQSGIGGQLEAVLSSLGVDIISVETATVASPSSRIVYYEESSYTSRKLERILGYKGETTDQVGISDILIIIGLDGFDNLVFGGEK